MYPIKLIIIKFYIMNSFEQNCKSEEDLIFMNNSLFFEEKVDFNFELNADQILLEVADYESLHTRMFDQEKGSVSDCEVIFVVSKQ